MAKNYYAAIDLGTTNSLLAWGTVDPRMNVIQPKIMDVRMMISGGGIADRPLLPSCVYFKEGQEPIVGEYARSMIGRQSARVVRSVKSCMGSDRRWEFDGREYSPADISAIALKQLASGAKNLFGFIPDDVVVTIPASFDSDMREATLKAAAEAGFKVTEDDGSPRNILLDEPRAALYDFVNRQERGEIPDSLVDLSEAKNILVFDLGGGTLDVSLHRVGYEEGSRNVKIDDYAVSRYTRIGGDDFDAILAKKFIKIFSEKVFIDAMDPFERSILESQFLDFAEEAKLSLNARIESRRMMGADNFDNIEIEIIKANVWDERTFEYDLSLGEYEDIISPLLGAELTAGDATRLDSLPPESADTIIYPILDVLRKAQEKSGSDVKVDAVLLNGGMTKLETIRKRLEGFFGFPCISAGDPDKAVARGGVVYHFNLHRGNRPTGIVNDTIGIGVAGGGVKHLVQAGTTLPYKSPVMSDFAALTGAHYLDLPFYLGRRTDTAAPNRKIATRRVRFPEPLKEGEEIDLQVTLDDRGIMTVDGWAHDNPRTRFSVTVVSSRTEEESAKDTPEPGAGNGSAQPAGGSGFKKKNIVQSGDARQLPSGDALPVAKSVDSLVVSLEKWKKYHYKGQSKGYTDASMQNAEMRKIKEIEKAIISASNGHEFVRPLIDSFNRGRFTAKDRVMLLLGEIGSKNPLAREEVAGFCISMSSPVRCYGMPISSINTTVRYAVEALGKVGYSEAEEHLLDILGTGSELKSLRSSVLHSLGKVGAGERALKPVAGYLTSALESDRMASAWAIGRMGTRERENPIPIAALRTSVQQLTNRLTRESHPDALRNAVYALGEVGDRRFSNKETIAPQDASAVLNSLELLKSGKVPNKKTFQSAPVIGRFVDIALAMIGGAELTTEQRSTLLALRSQLTLK